MTGWGSGWGGLLLLPPAYPHQSPDRRDLLPVSLEAALGSGHCASGRRTLGTPIVVRCRWAGCQQLIGVLTKTLELLASARMARASWRGPAEQPRPNTCCRLTLTAVQLASQRSGCSSARPSLHMILNKKTCNQCWQCWRRVWVTGGHEQPPCALTPGCLHLCCTC